MFIFSENIHVTIDFNLKINTSKCILNKSQFLTCHHLYIHKPLAIHVITKKRFFTSNRVVFQKISGYLIFLSFLTTTEKQTI